MLLTLFIKCRIILIILILNIHTSAQVNFPKEGFFVKHYSQEDGMVGPGGYLLHKDSRGFLWIGGFQGLSRFDGRSFTNFTKKDGLFENNIEDFKEDANGLIYVATVTGVFRFIGTSPLPFKAYHLAIALTLIAHICPIDSTHIYVTDDNLQSLYLIDGQLMHKVDGFTGNSVRMQMDKDGFLYLFTTNQQIYIIKGTQVIGKVPEPPDPMLATKQWFAEFLQKNQKGQVVYNGATRWLLSGKSPFITKYNPPDGDSLYYNYLLSNLQSYASIQYYNGSKQWQQVKPIIGGASFNSKLLTDDKGNLDFVSESGLYRYYPKLYATIHRDLLVQYYTTKNGCKVIHNDSILYNNPVAFKNYVILKDKLHNIYLANNGTIWFCTKSGIYYLINGKGDLKHYMPPGYTTDFTIKTALEDAKGNIWFETNGGVIYYDGQQFNFMSRAFGLMQAIYSSVIDKHNIYYTAGLGAHAFVNGKPIFIGEQLGIGRQIILSLTLDNNGNVWMCTSEDKLLKIDVDTKNHFFVADSIMLEVNGKPFVAQSIVFDNGNNLWVASYNQLAIYLIQPTGHFTSSNKLVLGKEQQLQYLTLGRTALNADASGRYIFLKHDSLIGKFDAQSILQNYHPEAPIVHFTGIQLFRQNINPAKLGMCVDKFGLPINPIFTSKQNSISFSFTGIVPAEQQIVYQYKLDGFDKNWQSADQLAEASYTNLSPGNYIFYVKAANINGVWSAPLAFKFTILQPWYFTAWAFVLWAILVLAILYLLFIAVKASTQKKQRMEQIVMEHKLKALRAQINPHFLQNTFTFLLQTIKKQPFDFVEEIIDQLSNYLRKVLDLTDVTVLTLENELNFADEYLSINRLIFKNSFDFTINVSEEVDTVNIKLPSMLLQPILENAIKHGVRSQEKSSHSIIDVKIYSDGNFTCCCVSNSINFAPHKKTEKRYKAKGLEITEERIELLYKNFKNVSYIKSYIVDNTYNVIIGIPIK